ncbi:hypothetical protein KIPB_007022, partial [Kipferlia bialata]|eukprot:g7022.t1
MSYADHFKHGYGARNTADGGRAPQRGLNHATIMRETTLRRNRLRQKEKDAMNAEQERVKEILAQRKKERSDTTSAVRRILAQNRERQDRVQSRYRVFRDHLSEDGAMIGKGPSPGTRRRTPASGERPPAPLPLPMLPSLRYGHKSNPSGQRASSHHVSSHRSAVGGVRVSRPKRVDQTKALKPSYPSPVIAPDTPQHIVSGHTASTARSDYSEDSPRGPIVMRASSLGKSSSTRSGLGIGSARAPPVNPNLSLSAQENEIMGSLMLLDERMQSLRTKHTQARVTPRSSITMSHADPEDSSPEVYPNPYSAHPGSVAPVQRVVPPQQPVLVQHQQRERQRQIEREEEMQRQRERERVEERERVLQVERERERARLVEQEQQKQRIRERERFMDEERERAREDLERQKAELFSRPKISFTQPPEEDDRQYVPRTHGQVNVPTSQFEADTHVPTPGAKPLSVFRKPELHVRHRATSSTSSGSGSARGNKPKLSVAKRTSKPQRVTPQSNTTRRRPPSATKSGRTRPPSASRDRPPSASRDRPPSGGRPGSGRSQRRPPSATKKGGPKPKGQAPAKQAVPKRVPPPANTHPVHSDSDEDSDRAEAQPVYTAKVSQVLGAESDGEGDREGVSVYDVDEEETKRQHEAELDAKSARGEQVDAPVAAPLPRISLELTDSAQTLVSLFLRHFPGSPPGFSLDPPLSPRSAGDVARWLVQGQALGHGLYAVVPQIFPRDWFQNGTLPEPVRLGQQSPGLIPVFGDQTPISTCWKRLDFLFRQLSFDLSK